MTWFAGMRYDGIDFLEGQVFSMMSDLHNSSTIREMLKLKYRSDNGTDYKHG